MRESAGGAPPSKKKVDLWRHGVVKISAQDEARSFYSGIVQDVEARSRAVLLAGKNRHHRQPPTGFPSEGGRTLAEASAVAGELRHRWSELLESHGVELDIVSCQESGPSSSSSSCSSSSSSSSSSSAGHCRPRTLGAGLSDDFGRPAKRVSIEASSRQQLKSPRTSALFRPPTTQPSPSTLNTTAADSSVKFGQPRSSSSHSSSSSSSSSNVSLHVAESRLGVTTTEAEGPVEEGSDDDDDSSAGARGQALESLLALQRAHETNSKTSSQATGGVAGTSDAEEAPDASGFVLAAHVAVAMGEVAPRGGGSGISNGANGYGEDVDLLALLEKECYEGDSGPGASELSSSSSAQLPTNRTVHSKYTAGAAAVGSSTSRSGAAENTDVDLAGTGSLNWQRMAGLQRGDSAGDSRGVEFGDAIEDKASDGSDSDSSSEADFDDPELAYLLPPKPATASASTTAAASDTASSSAPPSSSSSFSSSSLSAAAAAAGMATYAASAAHAGATPEHTNRGQDKGVCESTILADRVRVARSTDLWRVRLRSGCARLGGQEHRVLEWKLKLKVDF